MPYRNGLRRYSNLLVRILHLVDTGSVFISLWGLVHFYQVPWSLHWSWLAVVSSLVCFVVFYTTCLYRPWRGAHFYHEFGAILKAWLISVGILLLILFITKSSSKFSRRVMLTWLWVTPLLIFSLHLIARYALRKLRERGFNLKRCVIVGANNIGAEFAQYLKEIPWAGIRVRGFFDDNVEKGTRVTGDLEVLGSVVDLSQYLTQNPTDYVYVALPLSEALVISNIITKARTLGAELLLVPDVFSLKVFNAQLVNLGDFPLVSFNPDHRWKRAFDILFSMFALIVSSPVLLLIALLIKLQDGGPVFYGHKRITATGKEFVCWKFRTMVVDADKRLKKLLASDPVALGEWLRRYKLRNDPRVTKIGKFLRKTSLDELPQFFNVLKGDMSVVGARPVVPRELEEYYKEYAGLYCSIKPGITGPWQVGRRNDIEDYDERVKQDVWYIQNCCLWLDLKIIAKTILRILSPSGAY